MKTKFILIMVIGIFLISFTSATINVYANITRPTFAIELIESNGTNELNESTNYYFQCFVGGYGYTGEPGGPASEEFNITTNSTHKWINISGIQSACNSYTIPTGYKGVNCRYSINRSFKDWGGEGYLPASFNNNESTASQYWLSQYGNAGNYFLSGLKCSNGMDNVTVTNTDIRAVSQVSSNYQRHPEIAIPKSYRDNLIASGFNVTQGTLWIEINDTGTQNWNNLIQELDNSNTELYKKSMYGGLTFIGCITGTGTINITSKSLTQIISHIFNANIIFERGSQHYLEEFGAISTGAYGKYYDSSLTINPITNMDVSNIEGYNLFVVAQQIRHGSGKNYSGWNFNGLGSLPYHDSPYWIDGQTASNSTWNGVYEYILPRDTIGGDVANTYYINNKFNNNGIITYSGLQSVDIVAYPSYLLSCGNKTRTYNMINTVSNRENKRLVIHYPNLVAPTVWCKTTFNFTFYFDSIFTIIEQDGTPLENVNITLSNEYNTYTDLTNIEGYVKLLPISYNVYYNSSQTVLPYRYASIDERGLYNLSIKKEGYTDYNSIVNISEPISWTISLSQLENKLPASLVLDKIISLNEITNETISYNITLKLINKGESNSTNTNLTDLDSEDSPYALDNISNNSFIKVSYLKNFTRNSTTYPVLLSQAQSIAIDSSTSNLTTANSTLINLIIPSTSTGQQLTLIKNAYYNSENSTHVNYTLSVEIVNSGGEDLTNIILLDTDLNLNEIINLNRTHSYNISNFTIIEKAASNTNKLFDKLSATANSIVYQSNQIQIRIPGYGGPADAIVYSPSSVTSSTDFNVTITVKNMNPDIGQDFTIDYWITNENETLNYSSGQQTIYVTYSGESNLTAKILSPTIDGNYKIKVLVNWVGGTASAYNSFLVNTPTPPSSHSSNSKKSLLTTNAISPIQEVICNIPYIRYGLECCLDKNNNSICDNHEIIDTPKENISQEIEQTPQEETIKKVENPLLKKLRESLTKIKKLYLIIILAITLIIIILIIFIIKNKKKIKVKYANSKEFKKIEGISAYTKLGKKIGNVKGIYLNENSKEIYGWAIELDKDVAKSMNLNERNFFIKQGDYKII